MGSIIKKNDYVELIKPSSGNIVELRLTVDDAYVEAYMLILKGYAISFQTRGYIVSSTIAENSLLLECANDNAVELVCQEMQTRI